LGYTITLAGAVISHGSILIIFHIFYIFNYFVLTAFKIN
jgi:hypothetical protein